MKLQTVIEIEKPDFKLDYTTRIMLIGSCFVENIGQKLDHFGFQVDINPCGIVYNPLSVAASLNFILDHKRFLEADLLQNDGKWVSLSHHGSFSAFQAEACLQKINERLEKAAEHLRKTDVLMITWGTSWVYRYRKNGGVVSNCHKFPAADFERFRLDEDEIFRVYTALISKLQALRPDLKILFTVSPIRHWKDGAHGNQLSKAVLLLAVDKLMRSFNCISYFPSYEIVMDELRDYRFYAEDMLHISQQGIDYIWEKFRDVYISKDAQVWMERVGKLNKILQHRPSDDTTDAYRSLREKTEQELREIKDRLGQHSG